MVSTKDRSYAVFYKDGDKTTLTGVFLHAGRAEQVANYHYKARPKGERMVTVRQVTLDDEKPMDIATVFDTCDIFMEDDPPRTETMDLDPDPRSKNN